MAATVVNYTRKTGDVEIVRFDASDLQTMQDVQEWVVGNLPAETEVTLRTTMGGLLFWPGTSVFPDEYIVKDSNGKLVKMSQDLVNALFDEV